MASDEDILKRASEYFTKGTSAAEGANEVPAEEMEERRRQQVTERAVRVVGVFESPQGRDPFVLLQDSRGRSLPIFVGPAEAVAIHIALDRQTPSRPLTHDLMKLLIERLGGKLESVLVDDLYKNVFYAKLSLRQGDRTHEIDCRSSDAIALGLRFGVPIYVGDHVLEEGQCEISEE